MEVREIGTDELAVWDEFVDGTAQGMAFQKKEWMQLCNAHSACGLRFPDATMTATWWEGARGSSIAWAS